jgi:hypothetical protein
VAYVERIQMSDICAINRGLAEYCGCTSTDNSLISVKTPSALSANQVWSFKWTHPSGWQINASYEDGDIILTAWGLMGETFRGELCNPDLMKNLKACVGQNLLIGSISLPLKDRKERKEGKDG